MKNETIKPTVYLAFIVDVNATCEYGVQNANNKRLYTLRELLRRYIWPVIEIRDIVVGIYHFTVP